MSSTVWILASTTLISPSQYRLRSLSLASQYFITQ
jgi:hypothetical protein